MKMAKDLHLEEAGKKMQASAKDLTGVRIVGVVNNHDFSSIFNS